MQAEYNSENETKYIQRLNIKQCINDKLIYDSRAEYRLDDMNSKEIAIQNAAHICTVRYSYRLFPAVTPTRNCGHRHWLDFFTIHRHVIMMMISF